MGMNKMTHSMEFGKAAEDAATAYLKHKGFEILECNYQAGHGEIDIVAKKDFILAFVEVKASATNIPPEIQITKKKIKTLAESAEKYLLQKKITGLDCRFDVLAMKIDQGLWKIKHYEDAFRP
jgi:putative endonuclease